MQRRAINFFRSYYEVAVELPLKHQREFVMAILEYQFTGIEPEVSKAIKLAWISQKHSLDRQLQGFEHGQKGGRPLKGSQNPPLKGIKNQVQEQVQEQVQKSIRFTPPTLNDVRDYINDYICNNPNKVMTDTPERFVDFYSSKGWKVGKSPMKDWRAAVRTWMKDKNNDALSNLR